MAISKLIENPAMKQIQVVVRVELKPKTAALQVRAADHLAVPILEMHPCFCDLSFIFDVLVSFSGC